MSRKTTLVISVPKHLGKRLHKVALNVTMTSILKKALRRRKRKVVVAATAAAAVVNTKKAEKKVRAKKA